MCASAPKPAASLETPKPTLDRAVYPRPVFGTPCIVELPALTPRNVSYSVEVVAP
jgi:hypothetical protein